jgi:hypothetical protein
MLKKVSIVPTRSITRLRQTQPDTRALDAPRLSPAEPVPVDHGRVEGTVREQVTHA